MLGECLFYQVFCIYSHIKCICTLTHLLLANQECVLSLCRFLTSLLVPYLKLVLSMLAAQKGHKNIKQFSSVSETENIFIYKQDFLSFITI